MTATHSQHTRTRRICIGAASEHGTDTQQQQHAHPIPLPSLAVRVRSARALFLLVSLLLSLCALPAFAVAESSTGDPNPASLQQPPPSASSAAAPVDLPVVPVVVSVPESPGPSSVLHSSFAPSSSEDAAPAATTFFELITHDEPLAALDDERREPHTLSAMPTAETDDTTTQSGPLATPATEVSARIPAPVDSTLLNLSPTDGVPSAFPSVAPTPSESSSATDPVVASTADAVPLVSGGDTAPPTTLTPATASAGTATASATDGSVTVATAETIHASSPSSINVSVRVLPVPVAQIVVNDSVGLNATLAALLANASAAAVPVIVVVPAPIVPSVSVTPPVLLPETVVDSELPRLDAYKQTVLDLVAEKEGKKKSKKVEAEGAAAATLSGVVATANEEPAATAAAVPVPSQAASVSSQPPSDPAAAAAVVAVSVDLSPPVAASPSPASLPRGPETGESDHDRDRFNYAAFDAGAKMLATSPGMKKANSILISDDDRYLMVPCGAEHKHFVIQLSEDIMIDTIEIANLEHYASSIKDFQIMGSASHPTTQWTLLGTYVALDSTQKQVFTLPNKQWVRFIKLIWNTHYGDEYYCTLTYLRVYGTTMLETFHQEMQQSEVDVQEITQTIMQAKPNKNSKTEVDDTTNGQTAALPAVTHAADTSPTIEVEVSESVQPTLAPLAASDPVQAASAPVVDESGAAVPLVPLTATVPDPARTDDNATVAPQSPTELMVPSIIAEAPVQDDASNVSSSNASFSIASPDSIPSSTAPSRPADETALPAAVSPTVQPALLHDAVIFDTGANLMAAGAETISVAEATQAIDTQQQMAGDITRATEPAPNGTEDLVTAPSLSTEQSSHAPPTLITPAGAPPPIAESSITAAVPTSVLVAELIVPTASAVAAPSAPSAAVPAGPLPDPTAVVATSAAPSSRDAPFPSLPSLRSGSDRASSGSASSVSGQQSIFKSLTNRIKQLEIEQAMIHNYVGDLADQYNRDMANMRSRMEAMAHDMQAHRERYELQWRDGWAMLNGTAESLSADNQRVLHSVKAQMERAQETTDTVELVIQTQLWLSGLLFAVYFLGRWLLSIARYARKSIMRVCCWLRRRKRLTRHVHSKSSPSLLLTDGQLTQLQCEANDSSGHNQQHRQQRRSTAQHSRVPQRDHSRTMSMQPAVHRPRMPEQAATEPFDPRAAWPSVAAPAVAPLAFPSTSSLSPSHLVSLNPRRAHAVAAAAVTVDSASPYVLSVPPRPRPCLDSSAEVGSACAALPSTSSSPSSSSSRSPPAVHRSSLIPTCVEEEAEHDASANPSRQASPAPHTQQTQTQTQTQTQPPPPSVSECASSLALPAAESTPRRFSLSLLPRWITSPSRRTEAIGSAVSVPVPAPSVSSSAVVGPAADRGSVSSPSPSRPLLASTPLPSSQSPHHPHRSILRKHSDDHDGHRNLDGKTTHASNNGAVSFATQHEMARTHSEQAAEEVDTEGEDDGAEEQEAASSDKN